MLSRRDFIKGSIYQAAAAGFYLSTAGQKTSEVRLKKQTITYTDLPANFNGYRIAFVSDFHHGPFLRPEWLEAAISYLKNTDFDLLLLGGDYLGNATGPMKENLYPWHNPDFKKSFSNQKRINLVYQQLTGLVSELQVTDGIYGVFGNHDRWEAESVCIDSFRKSKLKLLVNSPATISKGQDNLVIHGCDDYWTGFPRLAKSKINPENFNLILSHNPDFVAYDLIKRAVPFHLALCGHTHGGQIRLPLIGGLYYNIQELKYAQGLVKEQNNQYIFTSNGLGTVELPYRWNCPPEVCLIELQSA